MFFWIFYLTTILISFPIIRISIKTELNLNEELQRKRDEVFEIKIGSFIIVAVILLLIPLVNILFSLVVFIVSQSNKVNSSTVEAIKTLKKIFMIS